MATYDWSRFSTRINIRADVKDIFGALSTRAGLERWFLRTAEFNHIKNRPGPVRRHRGGRCLPLVVVRVR